MQLDEAERIITENVVITRQKVAVMKALILGQGTLELALKSLGAMKPATILIQPDVEPMLSLRRASEWISYSLAGCEALWGLVHAGVLIQLTSDLTIFDPAISCTIARGNGGWSGGLRLERFQSAYPSRVIRSWVSDRDQVLADADLYLQRLSLPMIHHEVEDALRDSVRCFRAELFVPSVVMLGKASEGAWIELGVALAEFVGASDPKIKKWADGLTGPEIGFAKKLRDIVIFYETRQTTLKPVAQQAGTTLEDLRTAMLWSDTLRDARNAIHHRVSTSTDASYEMVVTLLLAAVPHLQTIYSLYRAVHEAKPLSVPPTNP